MIKTNIKEDWEIISNRIYKDFLCLIMYPEMKRNELFTIQIHNCPKKLSYTLDII